MTRSIIFFSLALILSHLGSAVSAQENPVTDSFAAPRVASLESSPSTNAEPVLVDLEVDASPSSPVVDNTPINFGEIQPEAPTDLDQRQAEVQGRVFFDTLRLLGFAALLICASIVGLVFYGQRKANTRRRRQRWD